MATTEQISAVKGIILTNDQTAAEIADAVLSASPANSRAEPFGYYCECKGADPAFLRKPSYIPPTDDLHTTTPLYLAPANSRAEAIGAREADSPLLAASYYAMSKAMELLDADLGHGTVLNMLAKCRVDIENRRALLDTQQPDSRSEAIGADDTKLLYCINIGRRPDGGLRVWSDQIIGLILSGSNPDTVLADISPALRALLQQEGE